MVRSECRQQLFGIENLAGRFRTSGAECALDQTLDCFARQRCGDGIAVASACDGTPLFVTARNDHFDHKVLRGTPHRVGGFRRRCRRIEHVGDGNLGEIVVVLGGLHMPR
jgi:hypothetical protein